MPGVLEAYLKDSDYAFLICAAGYTGKPNVDACELHKQETLLGNAILPGLVRSACESVDLPFGYGKSTRNCKIIRYVKTQNIPFHRDVCCLKFKKFY